MDITAGRLELEGCHISSQGTVCIAIHGDADPPLRRNRIHADKQVAVFVYGGGLGTVEDNDITGNFFASVMIQDGGNPTVRGNRIHDGRQNGVYVLDGGLGTVEDNDITGNAFAGVEIRTGGNPTVRGNRINRNGRQAVWIHEGARAWSRIMTGNAKGAWLIAQDCQVNVTRARNKE